jgi:hypothetical protein
MKNMLGMALIISVSWCTSLWAGQQDFILANETGVDIAQLYISAASSADWEEDLLGENEILPSGNELAIHFSSDEDAELWDIKIVDEQGDFITWERVNLTQIARLTLNFENGQPTADVEAAEYREVEWDFTLINETDVDITQIFISPASAASWGEDLLGEDEYLPAGNELGIQFHPDADAELWDIKVVDNDGTAITWGRLKLSGAEQVTLAIEDGEAVATVE